MSFPSAGDGDPNDDELRVDRRSLRLPAAAGSSFVGSGLLEEATNRAWLGYLLGLVCFLSGAWVVHRTLTEASLLTSAMCGEWQSDLVRVLAVKLPAIAALYFCWQGLRVAERMTLPQRWVDTRSAEELSVLLGDGDPSTYRQLRDRARRALVSDVRSDPASRDE